MTVVPVLFLPYRHRNGLPHVLFQLVQRGILHELVVDTADQLRTGTQDDSTDRVLEVEAERS